MQTSGAAVCPVEKYCRHKHLNPRSFDGRRREAEFDEQPSEYKASALPESNTVQIPSAAGNLVEG